MKKILLGLCLLITGTLCVKAQGLDGFVVEKFYVTNAADNAGNGVTATALPTGSVVWRFYADLATGWELQSVYGDPGHQLLIQTTTSFFNNTDRGNEFANGINANFINQNTVYIDSYLSLGGTCSNRLGVVKTDDDAVNNIAFGGGYLQNNDASAGSALTARDGSLSTTGTPPPITPAGISAQLGLFAQSPTAGNSFQSNNGAWATTSSAQGSVGNKVLIAQITSDGVLTYAFNLQVRNTTTLAVENWVSSNPAGAELVLASLAGVVNQANALPTVSITSPSNGATFLTGAPVTIDANANDADGTIASVQFKVDGNVVNTDLIAPYEFIWTSTVGTHVLTAVATDNLGGIITSAPVTIVVGNVIPPTVSITAPAGGSTFVLGDVVIINANAADADGTVSGVEFFVNGVSVGSDNGSPYTISWPSVVGLQSLTAVATDNNNATTTSSTVSITVFDSSSAYVLLSSTNPCTSNNFCLPLNAIVPVDDVIGYDIVLQYDINKVQPTGVITVGSDLIDPSTTSTANSIDNINGLMYISVFFNASAAMDAEFNGTGELLCVQFARLGTFGSEDTADFSITSLQESYINGVLPKVVSPGQYITFQDGAFNSNLKFWFDNSPIRYDALNPSTYLITNVYGNDNSCGNQSVAAVQPDLNGDFSYDIVNGPSVDINKDIAGTTSVQPVVNGFDAFLTRRVLINDATFIPSVYQMIAMDVNIDGVVSAGDLSQINQRAVLILNEFRQAWNYNSSGVSNGEPSKDWLFIDATTLNGDPAYLISSNFPFDDGIGFSKSNVPVVSFCHVVPVFTSPSCNVVGTESYKGVLMGDVNGNYATVVPNGAFRTAASDKVIFDLAKATAGVGYIDVPVTVMSSENVNALDFALQFNESKMSFNSIVSNNNNMESLSNYSTADKSLRFTSYSLQNYDITKTLVTVRFNTSASSISESDLINTEAFINGERVRFEMTGIQPETNVLVNVYPNPASTKLNLVVSENSNLQMFDANGRMVISQPSLNAYQNYEFNTQNLASGIYTMKVYNNNFVSVKKIVIE